MWFGFHFTVGVIGCYYRLAFHSWLVIYQLFELTIINNDKGRNSIAALVQSMPPVDWTSLQSNASRGNILR